MIQLFPSIRFHLKNIFLVVFWSFSFLIFHPKSLPLPACVPALEVSHSKAVKFKLKSAMALNCVLLENVGQIFSKNAILHETFAPTSFNGTKSCTGPKSLKMSLNDSSAGFSFASVMNYRYKIFGLFQDVQVNNCNLVTSN